MSRFAVDHRWLVYLPPTMAPPQTSTHPDLLEHPDEVLAYYRRRGVRELICEEKQMGSRAVLIVCRDPATVQRRFGVEDGSAASATRARAALLYGCRLGSEALGPLAPGL